MRCEGDSRKESDLFVVKSVSSFPYSNINSVPKMTSKQKRKRFLVS